MYGKAMSIPDELMMRYFMLVTDMSIEDQEDMEERFESGTLHPRDAKMQLAKLSFVYIMVNKQRKKRKMNLSAYSNNMHCQQIFRNMLLINLVKLFSYQNSVRMRV